MNGDRSTRGGDGTGTTWGNDGTLCMIGGSGISSLGKDDDGWINGQITGGGPMGGGGTVIGADGGASGIIMVDPSVAAARADHFEKISDNKLNKIDKNMEIKRRIE